MKKDSTGYSAARGDRNDCSVRALSIAANIPYEDAHELFTSNGRINGRRTPWTVSDAVHAARGDKGVVNVSRPSSGPTLAHFIALHPKGRFVVCRRGHAFAVVDGVVHDWERGTGPRSRVCRAWAVTKAD